MIDHLGEAAPVTVRGLVTDSGHTRVEVVDPDPRALPVLLRATVVDESGRGLALLDAMARRCCGEPLRVPDRLVRGPAWLTDSLLMQLLLEAYGVITRRN